MKMSRATLLMVGLTLLVANRTQAQIVSSFGGIYSGGTTIGLPGYGYSSGYSSFGGLGYGSNYQSFSNTGYLAGPGVIGGTFGPYPGYSSGYAGLGGINSYNYGTRSYYGTGAFGGFSPLRPFNRFRRFP